MTVFWLIMLVIVGAMILGMAVLATWQTICDHRDAKRAHDAQSTIGSSGKYDIGYLNRADTGTTIIEWKVPRPDPKTSLKQLALYHWLAGARTLTPGPGPHDRRRSIKAAYDGVGREVEAIPFEAWPARPLWTPPGREWRKAVAFPVLYGATSTPAQREAWSKFILNGGKMPRAQ